ncbi:hypothetical protein HPB49_004403 [Dermacentor silvarum]|uniref:Uncharacterized protein n=1 Tax=Dermacentor silvarum TaxID=543639 RepID=A0ACB8DMX7_DERSI|nr:hypothetical protein HPB49_004403 [Dermacentor silvarum]
MAGPVRESALREPNPLTFRSALPGFTIDERSRLTGGATSTRKLSMNRETLNTQCACDFKPKMLNTALNARNAAQCSGAEFVGHSEFAIGIYYKTRRLSPVNFHVDPKRPTDFRKGELRRGCDTRHARGRTPDAGPKKESPPRRSYGAGAFQVKDMLVLPQSTVESLHNALLAVVSLIMAHTNTDTVILQCNSRGYRHKEPVFRQHLCTSSRHPGVIILQETHDTPITLPGYQPFIAANAPHGVSTLVRHRITEIEHDLDDRRTEHLFIELIPYQKRMDGIFILNIYYAPSLRRSRFLTVFKKTLNAAGSSLRVIGGDFNLPHTRWGYKHCSAAGRNLWRDSHDLGFNLITDPTVNKDRFSIACYRALPAAMDQLEEWRPPTLDDPWRLQLWPYRPHSPIVWFAQVDAQLYVNGVSSQLWRYLLLKREIPTDVFSRLDLLSSDQNMYEGLKTAFFQHFGVPVPDHLRSTTQFPSTADASEGMAQTTSSSSPSEPGERCATARESCAAPTPQEPLCGDNKTTAPPSSRSFPDGEQPPATLPAPSTTQLVSPLVLSNDHLASTPEHTKESACTPPPPELHGVPSPSCGDDSAASRALTADETHISAPVPHEILRQHCGETVPPAITCTELPSYASVFLVEPLSHVSSRSAPRPAAPLLRRFSSLRPPDFTQVPGRTLLQRTSKAPALNTKPMFTERTGSRRCGLVTTVAASAGVGFDVAVGADAPHHRLHRLTSPNLDDVIVAAAFPAPFCGRPSMLTDHTSASAA